MFIGSYVFGLAPLVCNISDRYMKRLVSFGAGMLLSTATTILIPEAFMSNVHYHYNESTENHVEMSHASGSIITIGFLLIIHGLDQASYRLSTGNRNNYWVSTLGLCLHAGCDGIAVGAAALSSSTTFKLTVFLAMGLHKAPVAFGLSSILIEHGLSTLQIARKYLLLFSLTSPVFALLTYMILGISGYASTSSLGGGSATGALLMLSAGTFLYIATVHTLPGIFPEDEDSEYSIDDELRKDRGNLVAIFFGCLVPMATALLPHSH
ncbi:hypothetical protein ACOME3_004025 [Neoechinorhynchus agilis]